MEQEDENLWRKRNIYAGCDACDGTRAAYSACRTAMLR